MKKKITKTVLIISAAAVIIGIALCAAGAAQNGSFNGLFRNRGGEIYFYDDGIGVRGGEGHHGSGRRGDFDDDFDDGFDDDFYDNFEDFWEDFDYFYGGENSETSL